MVFFSGIVYLVEANAPYMEKKVVDTLIALTTSFYEITGQNFSDSRQFVWPGWHTLLAKYQEKIYGAVLDIACGNGRFGEFLLESTATINKYIGIDNNQQLLEEARKKTAHHQKAHFFQLNVLETIQTQALAEVTEQTQFQLITVFGFLHHIPSKDLRDKCLSTFASLLSPTGYLVFTTWQFLEFERLRKKCVDPNTIGILPEKLETGDYIMDWRKGTHALRYCHAFEEGEIEQLLHQAKLELVTTFRADGKEGTVNCYFVCKKVHQKQLQ